MHCIWFPFVDFWMSWWFTVAYQSLLWNQNCFANPLITLMQYDINVSQSENDQRFEIIFLMVSVVDCFSVFYLLRSSNGTSCVDLHWMNQKTRTHFHSSPSSAHPPHPNQNLYHFVLRLQFVSDHMLLPFPCFLKDVSRLYS